MYITSIAFDIPPCDEAQNQLQYSQFADSAVQVGRATNT